MLEVSGKRTATPLYLLTSVLHGSGSDGNSAVAPNTQLQSLSLPASPIPSPRSTIATRLCLESTSSSGIDSDGSSTPTVLLHNHVRASAIQREDSGISGTVTSFSTRSHDLTHEIDWQSSKATVRERNAAMCNNELMADVHFLVNNNGGDAQRFPAHKYVLATGSSVFYAMFYGTLAEVNTEIVVPDVEPDAFLKMLR